jgi:hypothetical protein
LPGRPVPSFDGLRVVGGDPGPAEVVTQVDQESVAEVAAKLTSGPLKKPTFLTTRHGDDGGPGRIASCRPDTVRADWGLVLVVQPASTVANTSQATPIGARLRASIATYPFHRALIESETLREARSVAGSFRTSEGSPERAPRVSHRPHRDRSVR